MPSRAVVRAIEIPAIYAFYVVSKCGGIVTTIKKKSANSPRAQHAFYLASNSPGGRPSEDTITIPPILLPSVK